MSAFMIFLFAVLLIALYMILTMPRLKNPEYAPLLNWYYAHRGFYDNHTPAPENSLPAFQKAVDMGYGIELDVQLTKDCVPVVFHDYDLKRMCGFDRKVCELTYAELYSYSLLNSQEKIPSLQEVLYLIDRKVPLIIELKSNGLHTKLPRIADSVLLQYEGDYCIESFNPIVLYWYKRRRPDVTRGQLSTNYRKDLGYTNPALFSMEKLLCNVISRPDFISYNWKYRKDSSRRLCRKIYHTLSVAWTIRSEEELNLCRKDFDLFIFEGFTPKQHKTA